MRLPALVLVASLAAGSLQPAAPRPLGITHVTIIDTDDGSALRDMTVLVRDGRIARVERAAALPRNAQEVDGRGKYLISGLWDMHVHLSWTTASALPVLVANGVTGVRDVGSDLGEIDAWRTKIAAGLLVGPRILRVGPILNGQSFNKYQLVVGNAEQARGIVRALKQVGVDFIKVHRRVPRDAYFAIIDEAKKQTLPVVGHVPMTVKPEEASDAGQLIEHTETLFEGTFSAELPAGQLLDAIRRFRADAADTLFARFARNHTSVTPTLIAWSYQIEHPDASSFLADPRTRYVARSLRESVRRAPPAIPPQELPEFKRTFAEFSAIVGQINRAGVSLLAGTDIAAARIPGFFLHGELAALVDAGLSPLQALRAATVNPAKILKNEDDFGTVRVGKIADLVLLDANPLEDIRNTERIAAVVLGGRLLARRDLDALLKAARKWPRGIDERRPS